MIEEKYIYIHYIIYISIHDQGEPGNEKKHEAYQNVWNV